MQYRQIMHTRYISEVFAMNIIKTEINIDSKPFVCTGLFFSEDTSTEVCTVSVLCLLSDSPVFSEGLHFLQWPHEGDRIL